MVRWYRLTTDVYRPVASAGYCRDVTDKPPPSSLYIYEAEETGDTSSATHTAS